ncbi:MAG: PAS domain S-box protein [Spirochaetia bacterium]|nr:PAS domain S-box protein [Spirochaetia bacterium]
MDKLSSEIILESISDGVFTISEDYRITYFNSAAEKITGIKREEAIGLSCCEVFKSNMCESHCPLKHTFETGESVKEQRGYIVNLSGQRVSVSVSSALLYNEKGERIGGVETFRDISAIEHLRSLGALKRTGSMVTKSEAMKKVLDVVPSVASSNTTLLVTGESGSGKEVLARSIHHLSEVGKGPFIAVNCAAIPETLLESELFGYEKGAFTGAYQNKKGRIELASKGTLFIDEVGELTPLMQVKLLRVLQERTYESLGSVVSKKMSARVICATNSNLEKMVALGTFRQDLYYRINVITLEIPPLRERKEDIIMLSHQFLDRFTVVNNKRVDRFSQEVYQTFFSYNWPGNIRELENVVERAVVLCTSNVIEVVDLPVNMRQDSQEEPLIAHSLVDVAEKEMIESTLLKNDYNVSKSAKELKMHRATLYRKIAKYDIEIK